MPQAQLLDPSFRDGGHLDVSEAAYFGRSLNRFDNVENWPFTPSSGSLTRMSYVFQAVYKNGDDYGGIQLRGRVHTFGQPPEKYREVLKETAHRAAHIYNSGIQTSSYVNTQGAIGTAAGTGYLDGFNPVGVFSNWEVEQIPENRTETPIGAVDWSVEVYEEDTFDDADLAGIAQGFSYPYVVETEFLPGEQSVNIAPHKWGIVAPHDSRPDYYELRPPSRTKARERYRDGAGRGKRVYINGKYVGETDEKGRVWLKTEYARGDGKSYGGKWSRKGVVEDTQATYQAIRDGGTLYLTGESEGRIDLVTARAKPPGYQAADADDVAPNVAVRDGRPDREVDRLQFGNMSNLEIHAKRDETITGKLGKSRPEYRHELRHGQRWEPQLDGDPNHPSWGGGQ